MAENACVRKGYGAGHIGIRLRQEDRLKPAESYPAKAGTQT